MSHFSHLNSNKRCTVALDCDGVLLDFVSHFKNIGHAALGRPLEDLCNVYDLTKRFGLSNDERSKIMNLLNTDSGWSDLPDLPGAISSAISLQEAGHRVIVVTAIDEAHKMSRLFNLATYGFRPDEIYCIGSHSGHTKADVYKEEQPHAVVDDRLVYLNEAKTTIVRQEVELVWVNDEIPQDGLTPDFVHHEVSAFSNWAEKIFAKQKPLTVQRKFNF